MAKYVLLMKRDGFIKCDGYLVNLLRMYTIQKELEYTVFYRVFYLF